MGLWVGGDLSPIAPLFIRDDVIASLRDGDISCLATVTLKRGVRFLLGAEICAEIGASLGSEKAEGERTKGKK